MLLSCFVDCWPEKAATAVFDKVDVTSSVRLAHCHTSHATPQSTRWTESQFLLKDRFNLIRRKRQMASVLPKLRWMAYRYSYRPIVETIVSTGTFSSPTIAVLFVTTRRHVRNQYRYQAQAYTAIRHIICTAQFRGAVNAPDAMSPDQKCYNCVTLRLLTRCVLRRSAASKRTLSPDHVIRSYAQICQVSATVNIILQPFHDAQNPARKCLQNVDRSAVNAHSVKMGYKIVFVPSLSKPRHCPTWNIHVQLSSEVILFSNATNSIMAEIRTPSSAFPFYQCQKETHKW